MEIIALQQYTDKYISLYEGEIRNIQNVLAQKLIKKGIVAEHSDDKNSESGYKWIETREILTEETITTSKWGQYYAAPITYNSDIDADEIIVTCNGIEYTCEKKFFNNMSCYGDFSEEDGGPIFSKYPFCIAYREGMGNGIYTETEGTYTIKIEVPNKTMTTTEDFKKAVEINSCFFVKINFHNNSFVSMDKTINEITKAVESQIPCFMIIKDTDSTEPPFFATVPLRGTPIYSSYTGDYTFVSDRTINSRRIFIQSNGSVRFQRNQYPLPISN